MARFRNVVKRYIKSRHAPRRKAASYFGILTHRGRKSGRVYRTPINVFHRGDNYLFFLT